MPSKGVELIATPEALDRLVVNINEARLAGRIDSCYLDTEADSLHHYQEKLCLIQMCVDGQVVLIDPLAEKRLEPLLEALDHLTVWFHGADYDLTLLRRTYQWTPRELRDTQIAARLTGHREFGLSALVGKHVGILLSKASQKADWSRRPLPENMRAYAAEDVRHLPSLVNTLLSMLEKSGRTAWFLQSCESLKNDVMGRGERTKAEPWRVSGSGKLRPKGLAFLREAWTWREGVAADKDVPPFRIMNNQQLIALAMEFEGQERVSLPPRWRHDWKQAIYQAADRVKASAPDTWPQRPPKKMRHLPEVARTRVDELCKARDQAALGLDLEPSLIGSRAVYEQIVYDHQEVKPDQLLMPWQMEIMRTYLDGKAATVLPLDAVSPA